MSPLEATLLGAAQGLTEFLPVSSSGHLVIFQHLLGQTEPELTFDIMVHAGTLCTVVAVFANDIAALFVRGLPSLWTQIRQNKPRLSGPWSPERMVLWIILANIPTAIIGIAGKDTFEAWFGSPAIVGAMLIVTGSLLFATRYTLRRRETTAGMTGWQALIVGAVQGMAVIPGISRSGSTISVGLFVGIERQLAATFSFLASVPATLGAVILSLQDLSAAQPAEWQVCGIGALVAFGTGYISLRWLLGLIRRGKLHRFAYYCWAAGVLALLVTAR